MDVERRTESLESHYQTLHREIGTLDLDCTCDCTTHNLDEIEIDLDTATEQISTLRDRLQEAADLIVALAERVAALEAR
jgi:chromosome segregation ATPase